MSNHFDTSNTETIRLVSMDGGGLYGLATAIMLRKLCLKDPTFLAPGNVWMFAGTSAGGLNALLLASEENPRDVVLSGKLEKFWAEPGIYTNLANPVDGMLSFYGITAWLGTKDFLDLLHKYFGSRTLADLKHRVLITTFNWFGSQKNLPQNRRWRPKMFCNFPEDEPDRDATIAQVAYDAASPPGFREVLDGYGDGGTFVPNPSLNAVAETIEFFRLTSKKKWGSEAWDTMENLQKINHVCTDFFIWLSKTLEFPPGPGGWSDILEKTEKYLERITSHFPAEWYSEGTITPKEMSKFAKNIQQSDNPGAIAFDLIYPHVLEAVGHLSNILAKLKNQLESREAFSGFRRDFSSIANLLEQTIKVGFPEALEAVAKAETLDYETIAKYLDHLRLFHSGLESLLERLLSKPESSISRIAVLSLGVCTKFSSYWAQQFNLGSTLFNSILPTNAMMGNLYPPSYQISLDAPSDDVNYECRQLLGEAFHRLSPPLLGPPQQPPTLVAMSLARFDVWRAWLLEEVKKVCETHEAHVAVEHALKFLNSDDWRSSQSPELSM